MKTRFVFTLLPLLPFTNCGFPKNPTGHKPLAHLATQDPDQEAINHTLEDYLLADIAIAEEKADAYLNLPTKQRKYTHLQLTRKKLTKKIARFQVVATSPAAAVALAILKKKKVALDQEQQGWEHAIMDALEGTLDADEIEDADEGCLLIHLCADMDFNGSKEAFSFIAARTSDINAKDAAGTSTKGIWLLEEGADPTIPFPDGSTPLSHALIIQEDESNYRRGKEGQKKERQKLVAALRQYGANG